jgi:hypothetical protein
VDGTPNELGPIHEFMDVMICYCDHTKCTQFTVMHLGKRKIILGLRWLWQHNPEVDWAMNEVKMSHCLATVTPVSRKSWRSARSTGPSKIHTCWTGPLPILVKDSLMDYDSDLPGLSHDPDSKEDRDNESLEEGDHTFMVSIPAEAEFICTSQTTSQHLAEAFHKNTVPKLFHDSVPTHVHNFKDVFSKASFNVLSM